MGKIEPYQVCMQVNAHYLWVYRLEPTGGPWTDYVMNTNNDSKMCCWPAMIPCQ